MPNDEEIIAALDEAGIDYDSTDYDPEKSFRDNGIDSLDVKRSITSSFRKKL